MTTRGTCNHGPHPMASSEIGTGCEGVFTLSRIIRSGTLVHCLAEWVECSKTPTMRRSFSEAPTQNSRKRSAYPDLRIRLIEDWPNRTSRNLRRLTDQPSRLERAFPGCDP